MVGRILTILLTLACLLTPASAAPRLAAVHDAAPLPAWLEFCRRLPPECAVDGAEPEAIAFTDEVRELVEAVNQYVNRAIAPVPDLEQWKKRDQWDIPVAGRGDCEDFQLLKRLLLVEAGLPRRAMRMTVVDQFGEGHAVLTIRTEQGDFVLDNLTDAVLPWHRTGYRFIKRESAQKVGWVLLAPVPNRPLVAVAATE